jgi:hypothetical protein
MELEELERQLLRVAAQTPRTKLSEALADEDGPRGEARELLQNDDTTATGCYHAARVLLGPMMRGWEPESIWLSLERMNVEVSVLNRDKLMASLTLTMIPAFWFEINAFENTIMAFNNVISNPSILQEATPAQIAWAVYEAELLYSDAGEFGETTVFDREPTLYTAAVLNRAGFLVAPDMLGFAQEPLDKLNCDGAKATGEEVKKAWARLKKTDFTKREFSEDSPIDLQLGRLAAVTLYVQERLKQYENDLAQLRI